MAITKTDKYHFETYTVSAGATKTVYIDGLALPVTIGAYPGGGGTAKVEITNSGAAAVEAGTHTLIAWPEGTSGTVSTATTSVLTGPATAVKFTATTAAAVFTITAPRS